MTDSTGHVTLTPRPLVRLFVVECFCVYPATFCGPVDTTVAVASGVLHWRSHGGLGVRTSPLFKNMGLVICPNLHRNSEGTVGEELRT